MSVYLDKKRKTWRYDFVMEGVRYHGSQFQTKKEARKAEAERRKQVEYDLQNPQPQPRVETHMDFLTLINRRLAHVEAYFSESHFNDTLYAAKRWAKRWKKLKVEDITSEMLEKYIFERLKISSYVANKEIRQLRAMFNLGIKKKWIKENPANDLDFFPVEKKVKYVPSIVDIKKVISQGNQEQQDYLTLIWHTMARVGEINRLTWDDVSLEQQYVLLYTRKKKGGHLTPRKVKMTKEVFEILSRKNAHRDKNKPWVFWHKYYDQKKNKFVTGPYQDRKRLMENLCKKAEVKYFRYHALRHAGASLLDDQNVPISTIQKLLGHENRTTTEIYLHSMDGRDWLAMDTFERAIN